MSQLNNNTAALLAILDAVNALPEGSSEVPAARTATGTQTGSGTQSFTVSGLSFKPSHVVVIAVRNSTTAYNIVVFNVAGITGHAYATATNTTPYSFVDSSGSWNFTDNGFSVSTTAHTNSKFNSSYTYRWIAVE